MVYWLFSMCRNRSLECFPCSTKLTFTGQGSQCICRNFKPCETLTHMNLVVHLVHYHSAWFSELRTTSLTKWRQTGVNYDPGTFLDCPISFRTRRAVAESQPLRFQRSFIHVFLIWTGVAFVLWFFRHIQLSVFRHINWKWLWKGETFKRRSRNGPGITFVCFEILISSYSCWRVL